MNNIISTAALTLSAISIVTIGTLYVKRDDIIRNQIVENPDIITEAITVLQRREMASRLGTFKTPLTTPFYDGYAGNPNGDITLVEMSDYNCGFCRRSLADVEKLITEDNNIRVIYKETPVLAESSLTAAQWSLAAAKQGKSREFHNALFNIGLTDENSINNAAKRAGLNIEEAKQELQSGEIENEIRQNLAIMREIGLTGTPSFIIGDEVLEGAVGYDALKEAIERARAQL